MTVTNRKLHPMYEAALQDNPLLQMEEGITPTDQHAPLLFGKIGYLFFYYIQNQPTFRPYKINSDRIAAYMQSKGLIDVNWDARTFHWKRQPMTQLEFLRFFQMNQKATEVDAEETEEDDTDTEEESAPANRRAKPRK
jgi:hypothetical protein